MKPRFLNFSAPSLSTLGEHACLRLLVPILAMVISGVINEAPAAPKPTPTPTATATPVAAPTATVAATATPDPAATPTYNGTQQGQYISTAREAFVALRTTKSQPFLDAHKALDAAGSLSGKGLKTKEDIAARRDLVAKASAANAEYLEFVKTQEDAYRAELAKTPLIPGDIDTLVKQFAEKANTATVVKMREAQRDALQAGDEMLVALDKKFGAWSASDAWKISFKKKSDVNSFGALAAKYNAKVTEIQKLREELTPPVAASPSPSPVGTPDASPAAKASVAPTATVKP